MVTQAKQWKSKTKVGEHELTLPSENVALCRGIKPEAFLESGLIPEPMGAMVRKAINSKQGLPPKAMNEIANDPKKLAAAMETFDRALVYCVVEPVVEMPPICIHEVDGEKCGALYTGGDGVHVDRKHKNFHKYVEDERDPDILYADMVDMEDKQFIFQWAIGGHSDVARFRRERDAAMGSVPQG